MKRWNTHPSYTLWDEVLHKRVNNCHNSIDPPCHSFEEAYTHLRDLKVHDQIRQGDITQTLRDHGISGTKEYRRMRKRLSRIVTKTTEGSMGRSNLSHLETKEQPIDVHGSVWWTARLPPDLIAGLPWHGKGNRGWHGIVTPSVTMMVFGDGRVKVHDHIGDPSWRIALVQELRLCGWTDQELGLLMEDIRRHDEEAHIVARNPGATPGIKEVSCNGNVIHTTDHTPYFNGSEELIVRLKSYFDDLYAQVHSLPKDLGLITAGLPITTILNNIVALVSRQGERISDLELNGVKKLSELNGQSLNTVVGSNPTSPLNGAPREAVSSASPAESAGVLSDHSTPVFLSDNKSQLAIQLSVTKAPSTGEPSKTSLNIERSPDRPRYCPRLKEYDNYLFCRGTILKREDGTETPAGELLLATCAGAYENCRWFK